MNDNFCAVVNRDEHVPMKINRVFDSCCDRECLKNIPVILNGDLPNNINLVKARCVTVSDVNIDVEPVPFNKGYFSVEITYTFDVEILAYERASDTPRHIKGIAYETRSSILFGGESGVKTFTSTGKSTATVDTGTCGSVSLPIARVSVVEPIVLDAKIGTVTATSSCCCDFDPRDLGSKRTVLLTLGLFSVVELTRPVTMMVLAGDYAVPKRECTQNKGTDSPCDIFDRIKFPIEDFSPSAIDAIDFSSCKCGCNECKCD